MIAHLASRASAQRLSRRRADRHGRRDRPQGRTRLSLPREGSRSPFEPCAASGERDRDRGGAHRFHSHAGGRPRNGPSDAEYDVVHSDDLDRSHRRRNGGQYRAEGVRRHVRVPQPHRGRPRPSIIDRYRRPTPNDVHPTGDAAGGAPRAPSSSRRSTTTQPIRSMPGIPRHTAEIDGPALTDIPRWRSAPKPASSRRTSASRPSSVAPASSTSRTGRTSSSNRRSSTPADSLGTPAVLTVIGAGRYRVIGVHRTWRQASGRSERRLSPTARSRPETGRDDPRRCRYAYRRPWLSTRRRPGRTAASAAAAPVGAGYQRSSLPGPAGSTPTLGESGVAEYAKPEWR